METLIFNGSPRKNGDTAGLLRELKGFLKGEVTEVSAYGCGISPCVDCRACRSAPGCALRDGWEEIDGILRRCQAVVIATPIYYSLPTGPLLSLLSRLQQYYSAKAFRGETCPLAGNRRGGLILVGGGDGSMRPAEEACATLLKAMGCREPFPTVSCHRTDRVPALREPGVSGQLRELAEHLTSNEE